METGKTAWLSLAIGLLLVSLVLTGCGGATAGRGSGLTPAQQRVQTQGNTEYFLEQAGFKKYQVNQTMSAQEALLSTLPKRTLVNYERDGKKLHAYGDKDSRTLYIGDEAAYQRYLSLAQGRSLCEVREGGQESPKFWGCMEEYRQGGGKQPGR